MTTVTFEGHAWHATADPDPHRWCCPYCRRPLAGLLDECREPACVRASLDEDRTFDLRSPA